MAQQKQLPTITEVTYNNDGTVDIYTYYDQDVIDGLPNTLKAVIATSTGTNQGTPFTEGDLLITMKNWPDEINYTIDSLGNLILFTTTNDGSQYYINSEGDLMYDKIVED